MNPPTMLLPDASTQRSTRPSLRADRRHRFGARHDRDAAASEESLSGVARGAGGHFPADAASPGSPWPTTRSRASGSTDIPNRVPGGPEGSGVRSGPGKALAERLPESVDGRAGQGTSTERRRRSLLPRRGPLSPRPALLPGDLGAGARRPREGRHHPPQHRRAPCTTSGATTSPLTGGGSRPSWPTNSRTTRSTWPRRSSLPTRRSGSTWR